MTQTNFEIADTIVLELVNEHEFMKYIQPFIKKVLQGHTAARELHREIVNFQYTENCCGRHTHTLKNNDDTIQKIVTVETLKHYWEQYSDVEFNLSTHVPASYYTACVQKPEGPKQIINTDITELEIRVLTKYVTENENLQIEVTHRMLNKTWVDKTHERLSKYASGAWAWNTLCNEFIKYMPHKNLINSGRAYTTPDLKAHIDMFMMHVYAQNFEHVYAVKFDTRDIPPQCGYLLAPPQDDPRDDGLDAAQYAFATKALTEASEQRFKEQFIPCTKKLKLNFLHLKEDFPMNKITKIETVTRINDVDATEYTDDQIFGLITQIEKDIDKLEAVKEKPKKLEKKIEAMNESIKELVKIVDARD